ncbi:unnamed protein product [Cuscuta campestris]|uniref:F-box domain-containing protein n=1 Tax=Cuscuta campestris TaxID=132261 RepID=A0A484KP41_9ASTE|nr:unnamed protein product [Cuscuta campestris]
MDAGSQSLPEDIIRNILSRIPAKSLLRFQCVSKQWKSLIKTPSFIAEHLRQQSPCLLFPRRGECLPFGLHLLDCEMQVRPVQEPSSDSGSTVVRRASIVGSSNGLLCVRIVASTRSVSFFLWNPAIQELRMSPALSGSDKGHSNVGFGFSPIVNDYKIVILWSSGSPVEVYSIISGTWKVVEPEVSKGIRVCSVLVRPSVTANGAIFWLGKKDGVGVIVSFDIALELFTFIPLPAAADPLWCSRLVIYENKLALFIKRSLSDNSKSEWIDFWVMDERDVVASSSSYGERWGWTRKFNTAFPGNAYPLRIWKNGIICAVYERVSELSAREETEPGITLFNVTTGELGTVVIHDSYKCFDYVESLVPIGGK